MAATRYRLLITSTTNDHLASVTQITAADQTLAEMIATNKLRMIRLTYLEGRTWDRWDLGVKASPDAGWYHVATGDHAGTRWRSSDGVSDWTRRGTR